MEFAGRDAPGDDAPLDGVDLANLAELRKLEESLDPVPADLVDSVRFTLALEHMDAEVARLVEETALEGVRSGVDTVEQARTIIFESSTVSVMVSVTILGPDEIRVDGWLSPEGEYRVELRTKNEQFRTRSDEMGRFVIDVIPRGLFRLVLREPQPRHRNPLVVITPSVVID